MDRHPVTRILFFLVMVLLFAMAPLVYKNHTTPMAKSPNSNLPVVGSTYPIAGQEPIDESGVVLQSQDTAEIGELVRLDASASQVDSLTWQIIPHTEDFEVIEDGRRAFFSSRVPGSYLIIIAAAKDQQAFLRHHTIEVIGELSPPGPEGLATKVRRWTRKVKDYEGRKVHALAVAAVFRKLANAEDVDVERMLEATATANSAVLGDHIENWLPLLEPLGAELDFIGLETRDDYKRVWLSIAEGIEKGI